MLLTENIPLRSTSVWTGYHQTQSIPIVIGRCILSPIPYDHERKVWVISDAPILGVDEVKFGALYVRAWNWKNTTDSTGHVSAQIEFSEPVPTDITPSVKIVGMPHPITGALMENPADVIWWILVYLAGRNIDYHVVDEARILCGNAGLYVGGVLDDGRTTIRTAITAITDSIGAIWSLGVPGIIRLYPPAAIGTPVVIANDISEFVASASIEGIANILTLNFNRRWDVGDTVSSVTVDAPDSKIKYGDFRKSIDAPWLRDTAAATALAQRLLSWYSMPIWKYTWKTTVPRIPGEWITINDGYAPIRTAYVMGYTHDLERNEITMSAVAQA